MVAVYSRDNLNRWISDSEIDYFTYFIKAWIPFNAWYNNSFHHVGESDRAKINFVKSNSNEIRNAIHNFLERSGNENDLFKNYLANFYHSLGETTILSNGERISFESIVIESNNKSIIDNEIIRGVKYYLRRVDGDRRQVTKMTSIVKNSSGATIFMCETNDYNLESILVHPDYQNRLSTSQQSNLKVFYEDLNPNKPINLIVPDREATPGNHYDCMGIKFIRDENNTLCQADKMCKGLIEILYRLRNLLFHGELNPTNDNKKIYMYAYLILKMLIERIR
ncbi:hypothetical protein ACFSFW_23510 [Fredinandcohnia salidurans]|uniref:Apea-like HEPN domain-containing protein n=1 Tax=Fredinandcohnia salidurans TaxID=2595041 RepID=A0ABW4MVP6_9BACI